MVSIIGVFIVLVDVIVSVKGDLLCVDVYFFVDSLVVVSVGIVDG